jgi:hypothetical protein
MPISRILIATGLFHVGAEIFRLIQTCLSHYHATKRISWTNTLALAQRWLPPARMLHPFPDARFTATSKIRTGCARPAPGLGTARAISLPRSLSRNARLRVEVANVRNHRKHDTNTVDEDVGASRCCRSFRRRTVLASHLWSVVVPKRNLLPLETAHTSTFQDVLRTNNLTR